MEPQITMETFDSLNTPAESRNNTSHGFRQGGWNVCLHGNSCILSPETKFSLQIAQSASCPSFASISSERIIIGSLATTSLLAGGALGGAPSPSNILKTKRSIRFQYI